MENYRTSAEKLAAQMGWRVETDAEIVSGIEADCVEILFQERADEAYVDLVYNLPFETDGDEYIFMPSCCYDGNRFEVLKREYPPLFTPEEARLDIPVTITDVPRLERDGSGSIEITTGDVSVPCVGVYSKKKKRAVLLFTIQQMDGINLGLSYESGKIQISYPHMRKKEMYRWPHMRESTDRGIGFEAGRRIRIPYKLVDFPCRGLDEFYHLFFINRKCMKMEDDLPTPISPEKQFAIQCGKMNRLNWKEKGGFYGTEAEPEGSMLWQPGWLGGGMYTYALMKLGGPLEWDRSIKTLGHLFRGQAESGFFYESGDESGNFGSGIFQYEGMKNWHMVRKSADILYYLMKQLELIKSRGESVPEPLEAGGRKLADAFVRLWKKYGQYGQIVDLTTGDLVIGGSGSGAVVPAGLAEAACYYKETSYLEVAQESAEFYYRQALELGYTAGGPGDILQCPDSESAFALLESLVILYEHTGEQQWLEYSRYMIEFSSSWVVAYNYKFPEKSEFNRLNMKTTGCVFANLQNKHAAPGICTFSGYSVYKVYRWTGEKAYLDLFREITGAASQYMSTEDRPIHSWDVPKDAMLLEDGETARVKSEVLPPGFICERVNLSDWESERCIGGVFLTSCCWCETSNLMILAECSEIYLDEI